MNRRPPDPVDPDLDRVADELERFAAAERGEPPIDLASRIRAAVDAAPDPGAGWRVSLAAVLRAWRTPARGLAMAAVLVVAVVGALAVGQLINEARQPNVGTSPSPPAFVSPSPSISPTPPPSSSPSPSPSPSPTTTPTASPTASPAPPAPSPSDDDEFETPEPSESDNSGPGGGGGDNSGPGGGDD